MVDVVETPEEAEARQRLREAMRCPLCGGSRRGAFRTAAAIGVSYRTMYRFLEGRKVSDESRARIARFLATG